MAIVIVVPQDAAQVTYALSTPDALARRIHPVAIPRDHSGAPMELVRAVIRAGPRDLRLFGLTGTGMSFDLLIGAGLVAEVETPGVSLGEYGPARNFGRAVQRGTIRIKDATCPAMHAQLQAAEQGAPFMPLRGIVGSDLLRYRDDWLVLDNPYGEDDPIVLLPAVSPDFALIHGALVDDEGNLWIGRRMELKTLAHASKATLATAERRYHGNLLQTDEYAPGTIPSLDLTGVALAERGTWPCGFWDGGPTDGNHLRAYARACRTPEGFRAYVAAHVFGQAPPLAPEAAPEAVEAG